MEQLDKVVQNLLTVQGPMNPGDQPTVVNPIPGPQLFNIWDFDLWGKPEGGYGWPIVRSGGIIYWVTP
jgi:hypothetical protein